MATKLVRAGVNVQMSHIRTPDNFAALLAEPRIKALAASLRSVSQIHPVVVQDLNGVYKLWAGHDRFAAATLANLTKIRADVREGTEADFLLLQMAENDARRNHESEVAYVTARTQDRGRQNGDFVSPPTKRSARSELAAEKGIKPESQRRAEQRARNPKPPKPVTHSKPFGDSLRHQEREEVGQAAGVVDSPPASSQTGAAAPAAQEPESSLRKHLPPEFVTFGVEFPEQRAKDIGESFAILTRWRDIAANLADETMRTVLLAVPKVNCDGIKSAARALALAITNARPVATCKACMGTRCEKCGNQGVVGRFVNGDLGPVKRTVADVASPRETLGSAAPSPPEKTIRVVLNDGRELTREELEAAE